MNTLGTRASPVHRSLFTEQMADEAVLREAWYRVQRGGRAGGVDGVTVDAFRPRADQRLAQLREALLTGACEPAPVRRVQIPKPSGGVRVPGLPTIADRIAQTAAALVLHDRVAELFSDRRFAYRPFLGPRRTALFLRANLASASWVVTADIETFFDNVEHRVLADQLRNTGVDEPGVRLILRWLFAPADDRGRWFQPVKRERVRIDTRQKALLWHPSTTIEAPLIQLARGEQRKATTSPTSSGVPKRPNGSSCRTKSAMPAGSAC